jgi:hypothetical protein
VNAISTKRLQEVSFPIAKYFQYDLKIVPIYDFLQFRKGCLMGILMSSPTSGFRKWSEAHDPKIAGARAVAGDAAVIPVPDLDQGMMTPDEQPHRPWLVPGAGTL